MNITPIQAPVEKVLLDIALTEVPNGPYVKRGYVLPTTSNTLPFQLSGLSTSATYVVHVLPLLSQPIRMVITPTVPTITIQLAIPQGLARIAVRGSNDDQDDIIVSSTVYATILNAMARTLAPGYGNLEDKYTELTDHSLSAQGHWLLKYQDRLPVTHALYWICARLGILGYLHNVGTTKGLDQLAASLTTTTPTRQSLRDMIPRQEHIDRFGIQTLTPVEWVSAQHVNIWLRNDCSILFHSMLRYADAGRSLMRMQSASDNYARMAVAYALQSSDDRSTFVGDVETFGPGAQETACLDAYDFTGQCFDPDVFANVQTNIGYTFNAFAFNLFPPIKAENALGASYLDVGNDLDQDEAFDSGIVEDLFTDGWVGAPWVNNEVSDLDAMGGAAYPTATYDNEFYSQGEGAAAKALVLNSSAVAVDLSSTTGSEGLT